MPMKTFRRLPAVILAALLVARCGSNTPTTPTLPLPDVPPSQILPSSGAAVTSVIAGVTAADGTLAKEQPGSLPAANGGPTVTVTTNPTVVNGGSDEVRLQSPTKFDTVYVSVSNTSSIAPFSTNGLHPQSAAAGYFKLDLPAPTTDTSIVVALAPSLPSTTFTLAYAVAIGNLVGPTVTSTKTVDTTPPVPCQFTVAGDTRFGAAARAGTLTLTVTQGTNCSWTATSEAAFITDVAPASGTGDATVTFTVAANTATAARTGTLNVAGQTVTISQDGTTPSSPTCAYTLSSTAVSTSANADTVTITVATAGNCAWTASSNASFVTITGGASGTGNGTVTFNVGANSSTSSRNGTLTIAGQTVTVNQQGAAPPPTPCTYTLSPRAVTASSNGGTWAIAVTAPGTCTWTATSNASFLTITGGASGTGNGTVTLKVNPNTGAARTGTLTVAGQTGAGTVTLTVTQDAFTGTFTGTVASSPTVTFGGPPYCSYTITLTNITSTLTLAANATTQAQVTALATEAVVGTCPNPPIPPNQYTYTLAGSSWNGANIAVEYVRTAGDPDAKLSFTGTLSADYRTLTGTLTWQRVASSPFDWRVSVPISMTLSEEESPLLR
jgi:hypothetical protein